VLRRRLLLERPACQLAHGYTTADVEAVADLVLTLPG
jgi:hypothetical protein